MPPVIAFGAHSQLFAEEIGANLIGRPLPHIFCRKFPQLIHYTVKEQNACSLRGY
jgi:hypothetical protein